VSINYLDCDIITHPVEIALLNICQAEVIPKLTGDISLRLITWIRLSCV